jgi:hypothetical protein
LGIKSKKSLEEYHLLGYDASHLLARWFAEPISSTVKMEAICSSETSVETQRTTRRHIPEDDTLHNHRCEHLKSYKNFPDYLIDYKLKEGFLSMQLVVREFRNTFKAAYYIRNTSNEKVIWKT